MLFYCDRRKFNLSGSFLIFLFMVTSREIIFICSTVVITIKNGWNTIAWASHTSDILSIPATKSQKFVSFTGAQKVHYHKYETDYILQVWEKDCHLKKGTDICVTVKKMLSLSIFNILSSFSFCCISASFPFT